MSATGHALESCVAVPYLACVKREHYPSPTSPRDPPEIKLLVAHRGKTENGLLSVASLSFSVLMRWVWGCSYANNAGDTLMYALTIWS